MSVQELVATKRGAVPVKGKSDVVVVGGGPAGISAAVSAARNGASVTLAERYPYLGGLASGGMVLVLDDMHNDTEISVRGLAMEIVERMESKNLAVYPPETDRDPSIRQTDRMWRKWARWGVFDFHTHSLPHPIIFAVSFDPDGFKQASLDMVAEAGIDLRLHSWFSETIAEDGAAKGVVVEDKGRAAGPSRRRRDRRYGRLGCRGVRRGRLCQGRVHSVDRFEIRRSRHRRGRKIPVRRARAFRRTRKQGQVDHRRVLELLVAQNASSRSRLAELPPHDGLGRSRGGRSGKGRNRRTAPHPEFARIR